jgi:ATP-binding cassette subfamily B multidrug efflux pump
MLERLKPLVPYLRRYWKHLAWGGVAVILYNTIKVLIPIVIGHAIDDMQHGITEAKVVHHTLRLLLIAVLSAIFLYITRQVIIGASREIEFDLRNDLFSNLERQAPSFYHTHRTGDIMARTTNDLNAVRQLLGPAIMYSANTIVFTAASHQPPAHILRLRSPAHRLRPRSVLRQPHPPPLRTHSGHVLRHLRQSPGELLRRTPHPCLRAGRS